MSCKADLPVLLALFSSPLSHQSLECELAGKDAKLAYKDQHIHQLQTDLAAAAADAEATAEHQQQLQQAKEQLVGELAAQKVGRLS